MKKELQCPKCKSKNINSVTSCGGFTVYERLQCEDCRFEGGRVAVYDGEEERVQRQLVERFTTNNKQDDVKSFISSIV